MRENPDIGLSCHDGTLLERFKRVHSSQSDKIRFEATRRYLIWDDNFKHNFVPVDVTHLPPGQDQHPEACKVEVLNVEDVERLTEDFKDTNLPCYKVFVEEMIENMQEADCGNLDIDSIVGCEDE